MSNKTLLEIYKERKSLPTPAMNFIRELSQVTHRSEMTVKGWLTGKFRPDINTQIVLAHHLNSEADILFPGQAARCSPEHYNKVREDGQAALWRAPHQPQKVLHRNGNPALLALRNIMSHDRMDSFIQIDYGTLDMEYE